MLAVPNLLHESMSSCVGAHTVPKLLQLASPRQTVRCSCILVAEVKR